MNRNIYFTSDWHIGHENCLTFDNRPFEDLFHMHKVLVNNYNNAVRQNDICYFLGDIGFSKGSVIKDVVNQLNGFKVLVKGNHDKKGNQFWYSCGFDIVLNSASINIGKTLITMSHCPLRGLYREDTSHMKNTKNENWHGESKHKLFSLPDFGQFHLHGHIHSPNGGKSKKILDRQYDVGVVANNYRPVSSSQIESWICKYNNRSNEK